jgi:hypothetical protein
MDQHKLADDPLLKLKLSHLQSNTRMCQQALKMLFHYGLAQALGAAER